jgi:hypothetical protein
LLQVSRGREVRPRLVRIAGGTSGTRDVEHANHDGTQESRHGENISSTGCTRDASFGHSSPGAQHTR